MTDAIVLQSGTTNDLSHLGELFPNVDPQQALQFDQLLEYLQQHPDPADTTVYAQANPSDLKSLGQIQEISRQGFPVIVSFNETVDQRQSTADLISMRQQFTQDPAEVSINNPVSPAAGVLNSNSMAARTAGNVAEAGMNKAFGNPEQIENTDFWQTLHVTPRQFEVWELLAQGQTNKEIAKELGMSPGTVKTHVMSIYRETDVTNRTAAAVKLQGYTAYISNEIATHNPDAATSASLNSQQMFELYAKEIRPMYQSRMTARA